MKEHLYIANSGVAREPAIRFAQRALRVDRVMHAMAWMGIPDTPAIAGKKTMMQNGSGFQRDLPLARPEKRCP